MPESLATTDPAFTGSPTPSSSAAFEQEMLHISGHSSVFFAGTIFTVATGYLFKVYLARKLGAEALGEYALGMTIAGFIGIFNAFGLPQAATRFVSAYKATGQIERLRAFIGRSLFLLFLSNLFLGTVLFFVGPWVATHFYRTPALGKYFGLFAAIMFLGAFTTFLGQALAGYKDIVRRTVITNFVGNPLMMALTVALVTLGFGLRGYIFAQVIGSVVVFCLLGLAVKKLTPVAAQSLNTVLMPFEKGVVSFSVFAFGVSLLEFFMGQFDKVLIGFYLNAREVGLYAVAMALVAFVPIVLQSINQIFSATISQLHSRGDTIMLARIFQTLTKWTLGLTVPLAGVMVVFAPTLLRIFGRDFEAGWPILVIGTVGQLVNCAVGSVGYLLLMAGHQRSLVKIQTTMTGVMICLGILLVPRWGIIGAAVASAAGNLFSNLWYLVAVRRKLGMLPYNLSYLRLVLPAAATIMVLIVVHRIASALHSNWMVIAVALSVAYSVFVTSALSFGLDSDDTLVLRALWSRIGGNAQLAGAN